MNTVVMMGVGLVIMGYMAASVFYPMLSGGAGYTPTPRRRVAEALELVGLGRDEVFYDLGCGTGEVLIEASKVCDNVNGIELEPIRWLIAKLRARDARVVLGNLFKRDISDADVVFIFQYRGEINRRVARKIRSEVRRGTRVISYGHPIETMDLVQRQDEIFIYWT